MDNRKKATLFDLMFMCQFIVLGLLVAGVICYTKNDEISKKTRDCAQGMYFCITIIGLANRTTRIKLSPKNLTFDIAALSTLAMCCLLMFTNLFLDGFGDRTVALVDMIANVTAFLYLAVLWTVLLYEEEEDKYKV